MQQDKNNELGRAVIYTDSKITLNSIISAKIHKHLVEEIRKKTGITGIIKNSLYFPR
jgi:hypothetical protein